MSNTTGTVTPKMQVTIPKAIREEFPLEAGTQIQWAVENGALVGRRVRSVRELAGSLKTKVRFPGVEEEKKAVARLRARRYSARGGRK